MVNFYKNFKIFLPLQCLPWLFQIISLLCPSYIWFDQFLNIQQTFHSQLIHHPDDGGSTHPETLIYFNEAIWHYIPEGSHLISLLFFLLGILALSPYTGLCQSRTGFESQTSHDLKWDTIRTLWLRVQISIKEDSVNYRLLDMLFFTYKLSICVLVGKVFT
jgi:hypothetical protein